VTNSNLFPREALAAAAYRFGQANGNRIQLAEFDEILRHKLTGSDPDELAQSIRRSLLSDAADDAYRQSAYWVLAKKIDEELIPFFNERLRSELDAENFDACYQIMIGLDNLDVEIFAPGREGGSVNERDLNQRDAKKYLGALA
jgi:hypothetical protein